MNLQEALKSGKPFFRKSEANGSQVYCGIRPARRTHGDAEFFDFKDQAYHVSTSDIMAEDWELVEEPAQITRKHYFDAVAEAYSAMYSDRPASIPGGYSYWEHNAFIDTLTSKLGFGGKP